MTDNVKEIGWKERPDEERFTALKLKPDGSWVNVPFSELVKGDIYSPMLSGEFVHPLTAEKGRWFCLALCGPYRYLTYQGWIIEVYFSDTLQGVLPMPANGHELGEVQ